jgi:hypothetical protein
MQTRTLLLLSLGCGFAILIAGAALLLQLSGSEDPSTPAPIGSVVSVGDMAVTVVSAETTASSVAVELQLGGVDDPDGSRSFGLIASGTSYAPGGGDCDPVTIAARTCTITFVAEVDGDDAALVLVAERGESRMRWVLPTG